MKRGDIFKSVYDGDVCLTLDIHKEEFQIDVIEEIIVYLHPKEGILERSLMKFNGELFVGMKKIEIID